MRNAWKTVGAITLFLGLSCAVAQAQPLIAGNTAAFGGGPITTWDFSSAATVASFIPTGAGVPSDNGPNGRGLAIGGKEIFYTELSNGFGPSDGIHVALFDNGGGPGHGGPDLRVLPNPRPDAGIQGLTFANGTLFVLTGYPDKIPQVFTIDSQNGAVKTGPITIGALDPISGLRVPDTDCNSFAVLPNGNFLINLGQGEVSPIFDQFNPTTGARVPLTQFTVPGNPLDVTGVDTDGTSLYFLTDFNSITQTNLIGQFRGFSLIAPLCSGEDPTVCSFFEDISLVHPVTIITNVGEGHLWLGLRNSDDQGTNHDLKAELLVNGVNKAEAVTHCIVGLTRNPTFAADVKAVFPTIGNITLVSGDVVSFRFSTRIGTELDGITKCVRAGDGGHHNNGQGIKLYYDSVSRASNIPVTIQPNPEQKFYLHSDGGGCPGGSSDGSPSVTTRFLDGITPPGALTRCGISGGIDFNNGNVYSLIGTWSLAPQP